MEVLKRSYASIFQHFELKCNKIYILTVESIFFMDRPTYIREIHNQLILYILSISFSIT